MAEPAGGRGGLVLALRCERTRLGESVAVAGEGAKLRGWGAAGRPLVLSCVDPVSGDSTWPLWKLPEPLPVACGEEIEYKYLIVEGSGESVKRWEADGYVNRRLTVSRAALEAGVHDDGDFGAVPGASEGKDRDRDRDRRRDAERDPAEEARKEAERRSEEARREVERQARRQQRDEEKRLRQAERAAKEDGALGGPVDWANVKSSSALPPHVKRKRIGKGKQGNCFLVEMADGSTAVLKELKNGGRHAYRAEVDSLALLVETRAARAGAIPKYLGADAGQRQVLMSLFPGACVPDGPLAPALRGSASGLALALRVWLDVAAAAEEANEAGLVHCDLNPWNVIAKAEEDVGVSAEGGRGTCGCLVDWACAAKTSDRASGLPFKKRGDFQAAELLKSRVGPRTDVYGAATTLLWLLTRRTRKALDLSSPKLAEFFACEVEHGGCGTVCGPEQCLALAKAISWGTEESWDDRCPSIAGLRDGAAAALRDIEASLSATEGRRGS